jgi:hypothetical protein
MSITEVTVTGKLPGAAGANAVFTVSDWLADAADSLYIPPHPVPVTLSSNPDGSGSFSVELTPNDAVVLPSGTTWTVALSGIPGVAYKEFSFALLAVNGSTQDISDLVPAGPAPPMITSMPLPSGMPAAGQVPVATGAGQASAWETLTAASVGADAAGAAAGILATAESFAASAAGTAQGNAETFAAGAVAALAAEVVAIGANAAATAALPVGAGAGETVVAAITIPGGMAAGATYRITAWGTVAIGSTAGTLTGKARIGGLTGAAVASIASGSFTANGTGSWKYVAELTLQAPGTAATWSGAITEGLVVSGSTGNGPNAGTGVKDSTVAESFAVTLTLSSATSTASCLGSVTERIC